jgi:hypothetical protein
MDSLALGALQYFNHINAGLVAGTTNTITVTTAPSVSIGGKFGTTTISASGNQAITPTLDANTGVAFTTLTKNTCAAIVFGVNAAGTLVGVQGTAIPTETGVTTTVGAFINAPQFPALPADFCPLAYTVVRIAPSSTGFTCGAASNPWTGTPSYATCSTFDNVSILPQRPQIS